MKQLVRRIVHETRRTLAQTRKTFLKLRLGRRWQPSGDRFAARSYPTYGDYLEHQRLKHDALRAKSLAAHDRRFYDALRQRLRSLPSPLEGRPVLCLAARQGTEVRAFIDAGAFAVGVDLNPGRENRYVVTGDFHALQFATRSASLVYTNSLDHAFDLDRILEEVRRVLAADGVLVAEVGSGTARQGAPGFYESFAWETVDDLLERILARGFRLEHRSSFDLPWRGEQLVLRPCDRDQVSGEEAELRREGS